MKPTFQVVGEPIFRRDGSIIGYKDKYGSSHLPPDIEKAYKVTKQGIVKPVNRDNGYRF